MSIPPRLLILFPILCVGCATVPGAAPAPAPEPATGTGTEEPLNLELAEQLVAAEQARWPQPSAERLRQPHTFDDAMQILKRDQVTLFPGGVALARTLDGVEAQALEAQLELAWGESYLLLLEVIQRLGVELERHEQELAALASPTEEQTREQQWLQGKLHDGERFAEAFALLSIAHLTSGSAGAEAVIVQHPDSYLGYRVAADYYRTVRDWTRFDEMVRQIERLHPESNGLIFLRGTAAFQRDGDAAAAADFFRRALANDPEFVRAQAHLAMIQPTLAELVAQLDVLRQHNPEHQLVQWTSAITDWLRAHPIP